MKKTTSAKGRDVEKKSSLAWDAQLCDKLTPEEDKDLRKILNAALPFVIKNILGIDVAHWEDIPDPMEEFRQQKPARRKKK